MNWEMNQLIREDNIIGLVKKYRNESANLGKVKDIY